MATDFSNRGSALIPSWRQKDTFMNSVNVTNEGSRLDEIRQQRKRISYEKEYFMRMLKNIENESQIRSSQKSNQHDETETMAAPNNGNVVYSDKFEEQKGKAQNYFVRRGLLLEKSENVTDVVDRIIKSNKAPKNASTNSIITATTTEDAGEMINMLLNKTYPKSCQGRVKNKSLIPTLSGPPSNWLNRRSNMVQHNSWNTLQNKTQMPPRTPRWNISTKIDQPYVPNRITWCRDSYKILRPKTCKSKGMGSSVENINKTMVTSATPLNKKNSKSALNCSELSKSGTKDGTSFYSQCYASSSIALSLSTSSSNLSSSPSTCNAAPPLEVIGISTQLSVSPFSSNGCTPRSSNCIKNKPVKTAAECAKISTNTQTSISKSTVDINFARPKSTSSLEIGNNRIKNDLNNHQKLEKMANVKHNNNKTKRSENGGNDILSTNITPPSSMSPSKRGARRIRSREIVEELQSQLNAGPYMFTQPQLQYNNATSSNVQSVSPENAKISEMRKLVHELDNNLSISSQHSSFSSDEQKCDACIHTQHIIPTGSTEEHVMPTPHKVRRHNLRTIQVDRNDLEYSDTDVLGKGTFSTVYHGKLLSMDVAVKSFKLEPQLPNNTDNQINNLDETQLQKSKRTEIKERFEAEGHLMLRLRHPHIIQLLGACPMEDNETTQSPLLVFEYLESGSLSHYIHDVTQAPLDHATLFSVGRDVALALNYLHNRKLPIVHLDVKSANILLDAYLRAKLADLGLAQPLPPTNMSKKSVSKKSVTLCCLKGTPAFMAPEVLQDRLVSVAADVYGFGIILWEMSVALKPFYGLNLTEFSDALEQGQME